MQIVLCDYNEVWATDFEEIRSRLIGELGKPASKVEHVGSTSVPGLSAKPIIDILLVVADSANEEAYSDQIQRCGFSFHRREPDWYEHRLFKLRSPATNLHVLSEGCIEIERMLRFRDFLRRDANAREIYAANLHYS